MEISFHMQLNKSMHNLLRVRILCLDTSHEYIRLLVIFLNV